MDQVELTDSVRQWINDVGDAAAASSISEIRSWAILELEMAALSRIYSKGLDKATENEETDSDEPSAAHVWEMMIQERSARAHHIEPARGMCSDVSTRFTFRCYGGRITVDVEKEYCTRYYRLRFSRVDQQVEANVYSAMEKHIKYAGVEELRNLRRRHATLKWWAECREKTIVVLITCFLVWLLMLFLNYRRAHHGT